MLAQDLAAGYRQQSRIDPHADAAELGRRELELAISGDLAAFHFAERRAVGERDVVAAFLLEHRLAVLVDPDVLHRDENRLLAASGLGFLHLDASDIDEDLVLWLALRRHRPEVRRPAADAHRVLSDEAGVVKRMIERKFLQHALTCRRVKRIKPGAVVVASQPGKAAAVSEDEQAVRNFADLVFHRRRTTFPLRTESTPAARSANTSRLFRALNGGSAPPCSQARHRTKNSSQGFTTGMRASIASGLNSRPRSAKS